VRDFLHFVHNVADDLFGSRQDRRLFFLLTRSRRRLATKVFARLCRTANDRRRRLGRRRRLPNRLAILAASTDDGRAQPLLDEVGLPLLVARA
jgi:hypothetical protein